MSASALLPTGGVANPIQVTVARALEGSCCRRRIVHSWATAPPRLCPTGKLSKYTEDAHIRGWWRTASHAWMEIFFCRHGITQALQCSMAALRLLPAIQNDPFPPHVHHLTSSNERGAACPRNTQCKCGGLMFPCNTYRTAPIACPDSLLADTGPLWGWTWPLS